MESVVGWVRVGICVYGSVAGAVVGDVLVVEGNGRGRGKRFGDVVGEKGGRSGGEV